MEDFDFNKDMMEEMEVNEFEQQAARTQGLVQKVQERQRAQYLGSIKADKVLMKKLEKRGVSPEQYLDALSQNQQAFSQVYDEGTTSLIDRLFPVQTAKTASERSKEAREFRESKEYRGTDDDIEHLLSHYLD